MSVYYINPIFISPRSFLLKIYDILKINSFTCCCCASVENGLLRFYASRSSLLYSCFRYTIELRLQPYQMQLYTFRMQGLAFFLPWFPDYIGIFASYRLSKIMERILSPERIKTRVGTLVIEILYF